MILSSARCSIHGSAQFGAGLLLCSRDNRRKELFMNAKDKEKLNMAGTIVSLLKGDTIVIDDPCMLQMLSRAGLPSLQESGRPALCILFLSMVITPFFSVCLSAQ
jgi:hypothetical protein